MKLRLQSPFMTAEKLQGIGVSKKIENSRADDTKQSKKTLEVFAGIHRSAQFSAQSAHKHFAGLNRKK